MSSAGEGQPMGKATADGDGLVATPRKFRRSKCLAECRERTSSLRKTEHLAVGMTLKVRSSGECHVGILGGRSGTSVVGGALHWKGERGRARERRTRMLT